MLLVAALIVGKGVLKLLLKKKLKPWVKAEMTPTPTITILGGEITQTSHGERGTKGTIIKSHTIIKISKVKAQGSNQDKNKEGGSGKKSIEELLEGFMTRTENNYKNQEAAIKNLENQFG